MSSTWNGIALTLVILLVIVSVFILFNTSGPSEVDKATYDQMADSYYEYIEKNQKRNLEYYKKVEKQLARVDNTNERALKNQERFEQILDRWEKQADRINKLLRKYEKNQ